MKRTCLPTAVILLASLQLAGCSEPLQLSAEEAALFSAVDAAIDSGNPQKEEVVSAFGLPAECRQDGCYFDGAALPGFSIGRGNLSSNEQGLVLLLQGFSGSCIRVDAVRDRFGTEAPEQTCSDGECWGTMARKPWGVVYFGLDGPDGECATEMAINSRYGSL